MTTRARLTTVLAAYVLVLMTAVVPSAIAQCAGDFVFAQPNSFQVGWRYNAGVIQDFNADGVMDAAVIASGFGPLDAFFGLSSSSGPSGTLVGPTQIAGGATYSAIAAGDFNSDGVQDVAAFSDGGVTVLPGRAGGTAFGGPIRISNLFNGTPYGARCADLNSDGILDLVLSGGFQGGTIAILFGNGQPPVGNASFRLDRIYADAGGGPGVSLVDLDGDGILDIASTKSGGYVSILRGMGTSGVGDGTFEPSFDIPAGMAPSDLAASDFNRDGRPDLAVTNSMASGGISVLASTGAVLFGAASFAAPATFAAGANPSRMSAADLNGDGWMDLVAAGSDGVSVLLQAAEIAPGSVRFEPAAFAATQGDYSFVGIGDLNGDGRPDAFATGIESPEPGSFIYITCTLLNDCVDASEAAPRLVSIRDVPLDQGGRVKLSWLPSSYDRPADARVSEYWVWRSVPTTLATQALSSGLARRFDDQNHLDAAGSRQFLVQHLAGVDSFWEFVASQPASALPGYSYLARTPFDSTASGNPMTEFFVQARTTDGSRWFNSAAHSGYSVDNLPPRRVRDIGGYYAPPSSVTIHWPSSQDEDLSHYVVYLGTSRDFPLDPARRLTETADTVHTANSFNRTTFFKVTAVDIHGNESEPITLAPAQVTGIERLGVPAAAYLAQNHPNPFNPETVIEFGVPEAGRVTLRVYAPSGRLVRTLLNEDRPAGAHVLRWDGKDDRGTGVSSGVYVARLETTGSSRAIKMVLTR